MQESESRRWSSLGIALGLSSSLLLGTLSCVTPGKDARIAFPPPTEHVLDDDAESRNKAARRQWMDYIHKAPPGVDWNEVERENGRREQERRNELAATAGLGPAPAPRWTEIGSSNLAGRMLCAVFGPDGDSLYAGSALGGVWRGNLDGTGWEPLGDNLYGGVDELLVVPGTTMSDPDVIVTVTNSGAVRVTTDDGLSWQTPTGVSLSRVRGVAVLDDASHTMLLYGRGNGSFSGNSVLFASTDRGMTFTAIWQTAGDWLGWMWVPRTGPGADSDVYVLHQSTLLRSIDGGQTFLTQSTIPGTAQKGVLAGSEAGSPTLYAALRVDPPGEWQLHRSDDAGQTWTDVHTFTDFWESLCASSLNPNRVARGGVEGFVSNDGGESFTRVNSWGSYYGDPATRLHADIPGIHCWPVPESSSEESWFISTDGGLYVSHDGVATVENLSLNGLGVSQYYSTLSSSNDWDRIAAGAQDQGYQRGVRVDSAGPGPSTPFVQMISGDYGHLTSSDGSHNIVYSTYPGFTLVHTGEIAPSIAATIDFPDGSDHAWLPPVVADPLDPETYFFCGEVLYRYDRTSTSTWVESVHSSQDFAAGNADYISALAFAPTDPNRAYAVNDEGQVFISNDHGVSWVLSTGFAPDPHYFYGNTIAVHPTNADEVVVGGSGYGGMGLRRSTDAGQTWQTEVDGLPNTMVYGVVYPGDGSGDLYAATQAGAYRWDRQTEEWSNIMSNEAPVTLYWSVEAVDDGQTIRFGTYGRGIWDYAITLPEPQFLRGDCDSNLTLSIGDAIFQLSLLFDGQMSNCDDSCDANDDGQLDLGDVPFLLEYLFALGSPPPAPFPSCGQDPTPDALPCAGATACP